jgi:ABC-type transport system involved in multi-copper enzyme maturation permease subunit
MGLIALVALIVSSGAVASDVGSGASRYVLPRCNRLSWVIGKYLGHVVLLAFGLLFGAASATLVGATKDPYFDAQLPMWMLLTSFQTWLYGCSYLAIFFGVSQTQRSKMVAIVLSFLTLVAFTISHSILSSDLVRERFLVARHVSYLFPAEHKLALWSPTAQTYLLGVGCLTLIGAVAFTLGYQVFRRRDA